MKKDNFKIGDVVEAAVQDGGLFCGYCSDTHHYRGVIKSIDKFRERYMLSNVLCLENNRKLDRDYEVSFREITGKSGIFQLSSNVICEIEELLGSGHKVTIEYNDLTNQCKIDAERGEEKYNTIL